MTGYVGIHKVSNVLELCNAHEYATMLLEGNFDSYNTLTSHNPSTNTAVVMMTPTSIIGLLETDHFWQ